MKRAGEAGEAEAAEGEEHYSTIISGSSIICPQEHQSQIFNGTQIFEEEF